MKPTPFVYALIVSAAPLLTAMPAHAGAIERACLGSDRNVASRALCGCIQDAADLVLSSSDQRRAASFFSDPHEAQVVRQSDNSSDERFWLRYREFGETAEVYCAS